MRPARTSSSTVGETARSSSEPHSSCTAAAIRRRVSFCSPGTGRRSSSERSMEKMRASLLTVVRRRASVGCAVKTSCTSALASASCRSLALIPLAARFVIAWLSEPRRGAGASASSRARRRRTRSLSSARFMSWCQQVSIRTSSSSSRTSRSATRPASSSAAARVAVARAPAERDRAAMQLERGLALARADDLLEHAAQQRLVGDEALAGCGVDRGGVITPNYGTGADPRVSGARGDVHEVET